MGGQKNQNPIFDNIIGVLLHGESPLCALVRTAASRLNGLKCNGDPGSKGDLKSMLWHPDYTEYPDDNDIARTLAIRKVLAGKAKREPVDVPASVRDLMRETGIRGERTIKKALAEIEGSGFGFVDYSGLVVYSDVMKEAWGTRQPFRIEFPRVLRTKPENLVEHESGREQRVMWTPELCLVVAFVCGQTNEYLGHKFEMKLSCKGIAKRLSMPPSTVKGCLSLANTLQLIETERLGPGRGAIRRPGPWIAEFHAEHGKQKGG